EELQETIRALGEDPAYLEYLARRDLGLVRPGEVLVELPVPRPDGAPPSLKTLPGIDPATKDIPTPGR
ncbi:MAG: septum formation initiator family protein, partial [Deltaproteobacteria bacterium]|nr:septum formation initiator family protein [Deltaproteobacteria bacterium]